jgi:Conjugative transposon protein TcpC
VTRKARLVRAAGRALLWTVVFFLLVRGALALVAGPAPETTRGASAGSAVSGQDDEILAFAAGFARAYMTFSPAHPEKHARALSTYVAPSLGEHAGLQLPEAGKGQAVAETLPAGIVRLDRRRSLVTVAVALAGDPRARFLAVPVARDDEGRLAVFDYPSFASPPAKLTGQSGLEERPLPAEDRAEIEALLARFFPRFLAADPGELAYFLPPGVRVEPLGATLRFRDLVALTANGAPRRDRVSALATVDVLDPASGTGYLLRYLIVLERRDRWYVAAVNRT